MNRITALLFAGLAGMLSACALQPEQPLQFPYVTKHTGQFNGQPVSYTASVDSLDVEDAEGNPGARIVSVSYIAPTAPGAAPRPVLFLWNGGPISPSVYLHMGAFGPKRVAFADDPQADASTAPLLDNPHSLLDVADLVFFDPAGTGFSQALPGKSLEDYFSVTADAQQTAAFIATWLKVHGREQSAVYLFGESYGTNRAVETAGQLARLPDPVLVSGVVLFGQAVNIIEYAQRARNLMSYVASLPTLAAIGWYHGKAEANGASLEAFTEQAWDYARTDYLDALFEGNRLGEDRLLEVAQQLQRFSGLDASVFTAQRLRVSKELYRRELFKQQGLIIGRSDGRYVGPASGEGDGPPPDPSGVLPARLVSAFKQYLVSDLGVPSSESYGIASPVKGLNEWDWNGQSPFAAFAYGDALQPLFEQNPDARVIVAAGHHDTMTTTGASKLLVAQEDWPREQVQLRFYPGGHMAYSIEESARALADDLRALMADR